MPTSTMGTVKYIKVFKPGAGGSDLCFFGLLPAGGTMAEELILWTSPPPITAPQWIVNNATLLMLRDAYANQTPVTVTTNDNSAIVTAVQVGQT
jgi:hypothetical protein